jgi:hypothetical protein
MPTKTMPSEICHGRVELGLGLHGRLGHEAPDQHGGDPDRERADDEEPAPRELVDQHAGQHEAEPAADAEDRGDHAHSRAHLLARELVVDDRERQREDGAAEPLQRAERDQRPDVPGEDRGDAADEEEPEADEQEALLAVLVAELADDRRGDRHHEQERGQEPRCPGGRRVQVLLQARQRRHDHRLL